MLKPFPVVLSNYSLISQLKYQRENKGKLNVCMVGWSILIFGFFIFYKKSTKKKIINIFGLAV